MLARQREQRVRAARARSPVRRALCIVAMLRILCPLAATLCASRPGHGRQRRARADAQPDPDGDGRLRGQPRRHRHRGDQPRRRPRRRAHPPGPLRPPRACRPAGRGRPR
jgi:hypothetical protein